MKVIYLKCFQILIKLCLYITFLFEQYGSMSSMGVATNSSGNSAASRMGSGMPPSNKGSAAVPSSSSSSSYRTLKMSKTNKCQQTNKKNKNANKLNLSNPIYTTPVFINLYIKKLKQAQQFFMQADFGQRVQNSSKTFRLVAAKWLA